MRAKLARFYGSIAEVEALPAKTLQEYYHAIDVLEAREELMKINIASLRFMKSARRKEFIASVEDRAKASEVKEIEVTSFKDLQSVMGVLCGK